MPDKISTEEEAARNNLSVLVLTLEKLNRELEDLCSVEDECIDVTARRRQFSQAYAELKDFKKRVERGASSADSVLFPRAQRYIEEAVECLSGSYLLVYKKSENFEHLRKFLEDKAEMAALQNSKLEFCRLLNQVKEEIEGLKQR